MERETENDGHLNEEHDDGNVPVPHRHDHDRVPAHRSEYNGFCLACGDINYGEIEPDARRYECATCGKKYVYGIDELLMGGYIQIEE